MSLDSDDSANFKQSKKTFKKKSRTRGGEINYTKLKHFACAEVMEYIEREEGSKNINTLSCRLELYVDCKQW